MLRTYCVCVCGSSSGLVKLLTTCWMSSDSSDDDLPRICLSSRVSSTLPSSQEPLVILDDDDEDSKSCHSSKRKDRYSPIGVSADDGSSDDCKRICLREDEDTVKMRVRRKREEALVSVYVMRKLASWLLYLELNFWVGLILEFSRTVLPQHQIFVHFFSAGEERSIET